MKAESKYDVEDKVFFFFDNKIQKSTVKKVRITCNKDSVAVHYLLKGKEKRKNGWTAWPENWIQESLIFETLEDITNHMTDIDNWINNILEEK